MAGCLRLATSPGMKTPFLVSAASLFLGLSVTAQTPRTFTGQYTFGDSLSDSGNLYALTGRQLPPAPYFNGRFSNGPVFTELLGNPIRAAAPLSTRGTNLNFAVGGSNIVLANGLPTLDQQIGIYRGQGLAAQAGDLFTVQGGANDLLSIIPAGVAQPAALQSASFAAGRILGLDTELLISLGAKNIVVGGMPNLGATPRYARGPAAAAAQAAAASDAFNGGLLTEVKRLSARYTDVNIVYLDMYAVMERVVMDYDALGFRNVSSFYLAPAAQGGAIGDPNSYVFWDDIHPSARTHALLASIVVEQLNPEMPLGFAGNLGSAALALQTLTTAAVEDRTAQLAFSPRASERTDVYARFDYGDGSRARDGWRSSFDYQGYVFSAGGDARLSEITFVGGTFSTGRMDVDVRRGGGEFTMEDTGGRVYAVWRGGPVSLIADGGYGFLRAKDIRRTTSFGGLRTRGKTTGDRWGAGVKIAWQLPWQQVNVRPWFGLRTERVTLDGYTERDVPALSMVFDEQEARSSTGQLGVDGSWSRRFNGKILRLDGRAVWHGELGNKERALVGQLADNFTRPTTLLLEDGDGDGVELGGAATLFLNAQWSASLGYGIDIRSAEKPAQRGTFTVQTGF